MADPKIRVRLELLKCLAGTGDPGSDEPYVVVLAALAPLSASGFQALPRAIVTLSPTIDDVDQGELHTFGREGVPVFGIADRARSAVSVSSDDVKNLIILVALMESDGSTTTSVRAVCQAVLYAN